MEAKSFQALVQETQTRSHQLQQLLSELHLSHQLELVEFQRQVSQVEAQLQDLHISNKQAKEQSFIILTPLRAVQTVRQPTLTKFIGDEQHSLKFTIRPASIQVSPSLLHRTKEVFIKILFGSRSELLGPYALTNQKSIQLFSQGRHSFEQQLTRSQSDFESLRDMLQSKRVLVRVQEFEEEVLAQGKLDLAKVLWLGHNMWTQQCQLYCIINEHPLANLRLQVMNRKVKSVGQVQEQQENIRFVDMAHQSQADHSLQRRKLQKIGRVRPLARPDIDEQLLLLQYQSSIDQKLLKKKQLIKTALSRARQKTSRLRVHPFRPLFHLIEFFNPLQHPCTFEVEIIEKESSWTSIAEQGEGSRPLMNGNSFKLSEGQFQRIYIKILSLSNTVQDKQVSVFVKSGKQRFAHFILGLSWASPFLDDQRVLYLQKSGTVSLELGLGKKVEVVSSSKQARERLQKLQIQGLQDEQVMVGCYKDARKNQLVYLLGLSIKVYTQKIVVARFAWLIRVKLQTTAQLSPEDQFVSSHPNLLWIDEGKEVQKSTQSSQVTASLRSLQREAMVRVKVECRRQGGLIERWMVLIKTQVPNPVATLNLSLKKDQIRLISYKYSFRRPDVSCLVLSHHPAIRVSSPRLKASLKELIWLELTAGQWQEGWVTVQEEGSVGLQVIRVTIQIEND